MHSVWGELKTWSEYDIIKKPKMLGRYKMSEIVSYEELLRRGYLIVSPNGRSMWPMIKTGRDTVLIEKCEGRLKKYDNPLYKDKAGRYILHRVIKVTPEGYVICGDGVCYREYDIRDENVLGVVKGLYRREKFIPTDSFSQKLYARVWVGLIFMRKPIVFLNLRLTSLKTRILRRFGGKNRRRG